jgi:phenazine biosynthesis protein phzE
LALVPLALNRWGAEWAKADHATTLAVVGPGPGDPNADEPKMNTVRTYVKELIKEGGGRFLSVCLGHQMVCRSLGLQVPRKEKPMQGTQEEIHLFGRATKVGFYNSFCPTPGPDVHANLGVLGKNAEVCIRGPELLAFRVPGKCASMQFHPESLLTQESSDLLAEIVAGISR